MSDSPWLPPWPYIAHRAPSPARPLLPEWVVETDTVYWWVGALTDDDRREFDAVRWAAVRDGSTIYTLLAQPFTLLVVREAGQ